MYLKFLSIIFFFQLVDCANILGVFFLPSFSHQVVFQPIWRELSLRGHQVTVVTTDPLDNPHLTNLTEISVRFTYELLQQKKFEDVMSNDVNIFQKLDSMTSYIDTIVEAELASPQFQDLIKNESRHFDLILLEFFHPAMCALSHRFQAPIIGVSSLGVMGPIYEVLGNPGHPVLYPDMVLSFHNDLNLWQKIKSIAFSLYARYYHYRVLTPRAHEMAKKYFGNDIPYVGDLERNVSMLFINVNPLIYPPRAYVPAIVEMGQMHIKATTPLSQELQTILDAAPEGFIYVSLGSNVKSVNLSPKIRSVIIEALSELPYKVLWKWEADELPGKPNNVITRQWLPQQDVLSHKNIKAFVTQGGLQSTEEAISRAVPLVGMPFVGDQHMNVQRIVELGIGLRVDPTTMTKEEFKEAIVEVAGDDKYKKNMEHVRNILFDKPMSGLQKVIWWSEYVIRHKGAAHLRSPTADVSWFHYLMLDVVLAVTLGPIIVVYLIGKLIQRSVIKKKKMKLL